MIRPTHETLEQLATILSRRLDDGFVRFLSENDWLAILEIANRDRHRLVPELHRILCGEVVGSVLPDDLRCYLTLTAELNEERNAALRCELEEVVAALNAAAIEPILLKGAAALMDERRAIGGRMIGDLDVLVPNDCESGALAALRRIGFAPLADVGSSHTIADLARTGDRGCVDLHRELFDPPFQTILPAAEALIRAERIDRPGLRFRVLSDQDRALHVVLHAQVHNPGYYSRHLCLGAGRDLLALWSTLDWFAIERWMETHRMRPVLEATLLATRQFFGIQWPLSGPPTETAIRHHQRACAVEISGGWDIGIGRLARAREAVAPDRLAIRFGPDRCYLANLARQCGFARKRHTLKELYRRLIAA